MGFLVQMGFLPGVERREAQVAKDPEPARREGEMHRFAVRYAPRIGMCVIIVTMATVNLVDVFTSTIGPKLEPVAASPRRKLQGGEEPHVLSYALGFAALTFTMTVSSRCELYRKPF